MQIFKNLRYFIILFLSLCLTITLGLLFFISSNSNKIVPIEAVSDITDVWDGTVPDSVEWTGDGTSSSPYQVDSAEKLAYISANANNSSIYNKYYIQTVNIDLNNHSWTPINQSSTDRFFSYNGNGCTISNINVNTTNDYAGLFGNVYGAFLNITISSGTISGTNYVGAIAGRVSPPPQSPAYYVTNCNNYATVIGSSNYIGGLIGFINSVIMTNCTNYGMIQSTNTDDENVTYIGGVVGGISGGSYDLSEVINCTNVADAVVSASGGKVCVGGVAGYVVNSTISQSYNNSSNLFSPYVVGGLLGYAGAFGWINTSTNYGDIEAKYSTTILGGITGINGGGDRENTNYGNLLGTNIVGGIIGLVSNGITDNETNEGKITGSGTVGGVVGSLSQGLLLEVTNNGTVTNTSNSLDAYTGGVVGYSNYVISSVTNTGDVIGDYNVGGIVGYSDAGASIASSYNTGKIEPYTQGAGTNIGGIVGYLTHSISGSVNGYLSSSDTTVVETCSVTGNTNIGGIAGYSTSAISGCTNVASVRGYSMTGGIVGWIADNITLSNNHNSGNVTGNENTGGIASINKGTIITSSNTGSVSTTGNYTGGIAGLNNGVIVASYNTGSINSTADYVGGISGASQVEESLAQAIYILNSYNTGQIVGNNYVGGISGIVNNGTISNCYTTSNTTKLDNTADITANDYVGGILGSLTNGSIMVDCYSTSSINSIGTYVGAILGYNDATTNTNMFANSYYNLESIDDYTGANVPTSAVGQGGQGYNIFALTTTQMQGLTHQMTSLHTDYWVFNDAQYPQLIWQTDTSSPIVAISPVIYDGTFLTPYVLVILNNSIITEYSVKYENNQNPGTNTALATITSTATEPAFSETTYHFSVLTFIDYSWDNLRFTYNETVQTPKLTLSINNVNITNFTYTYYRDSINGVIEPNPIEIGLYYVLVSDIENYPTITIGAEFVITANIADLEIEEIQDVIYTGQPIEPQINFVENNLSLGIDYEITYSSSNVNDESGHTDVGVVTVIIQGIGNYSGEISLQFEILTRSINDVTINQFNNFTYSGEECINYATLQIGDTILDDSNYVVTCLRNGVATSDFVNSGTITVHIVGKNNLTGETTFTYQIEKKSLLDNDIIVNIIGDTTYTGEQIQPEFTIVWGTMTLTPYNTTQTNYDYIIQSYGENILVSTGGNIEILGNGNFTGTRIIQFAIAPVNITSEQVTISEPQNVTFDGQSHKFTPSIIWNGTLLPESNYTIEYFRDSEAMQSEDFLNTGTITVLIRGIENFNNSINLEYEILPAPLSIILNEINYIESENLQYVSYWISGALNSAMTAIDVSYIFKGEYYDSIVQGMSQAGWYEITFTPTNFNYIIVENSTVNIEVKKSNIVSDDGKVTISSDEGFSNDITITIREVTDSAELQELLVNYDGNAEKVYIVEMWKNGQVYVPNTSFAITIDNALEDLNRVTNVYNSSDSITFDRVWFSTNDNGDIRILEGNVGIYVLDGTADSSWIIYLVIAIVLLLLIVIFIIIYKTRHRHSKVIKI